MGKEDYRPSVRVVHLLSRRRRSCFVLKLSQGAKNTKFNKSSKLHHGYQAMASLCLPSSLCFVFAVVVISVVTITGSFFFCVVAELSQGWQNTKFSSSSRLHH